MIHQANRQNRRMFGWGIASLLVLVFLVGLAAWGQREPAFAQAGRKTGEKQKKNPNASGDPEEQLREQEKKEAQKIDKTTPPATISIDTQLVNVETVVYNKKTGALIQGLKKEHFEIGLKVGRPVARQVAEAGKGFVMSECPLAGVHIAQGADRLAPDAPKPTLVTHPIQILARAYGFASA